MFVEGRPDLEYFGMGVDPPETKYESVGTVATAHHFHSNVLWAGFDKNANDELDSLGRPLPFVAVFEDEITALVEEFLWRRRRARWLGRLIPSLDPPPDARGFIERDRDIRDSEVTFKEEPREQRGMSTSPNPPPPTPLKAQPVRTCKNCGEPGRYKDGRCVERWRPGPHGPGTVCSRCRNKIKRLEKRSQMEAAAAAAAQNNLAAGGHGVHYVQGHLYPRIDHNPPERS